DRCNLNCIYCTPIEKRGFLTHDEVLRYEEMARIVELFTKAGIKKVRITGGEPLIKKGIIDLIKMIKKIDGVAEMSLTTNGVYLKEFASRLKDAGINKINVSIDTLKKDRFKHITGYDCFDKVWQGIRETLTLRFESVKLNVIAMKGINEEEIPDFAKITLDLPLTVRFIEFFPTNSRSMKLGSCLIKNCDVKKEIQTHFGEMTAISNGIKDGPAQYYKLNNSKGSIGFINSSTENFCTNCNRIRINCAGEISPCLFSGYRYNVKSLLKNNEPDDKIVEYIQKALESKSKYTKEIITKREIEMSSVGG
ncbi:MAG: GTP 3',8-cyclase MoaA, partial [Candidatus Omnitrophota bacterium]